MAGFGIIPWGLGGWGGIVNLEILQVVAVSIRSVLVTLTLPVLAESVLGRGDALNPKTWHITDPAGTALSVLAANVASDTEVELFTLQNLGEWQDTYTLAAPELLSSAGLPIILPGSMTFRGVALSQRLTHQIGPHDLASIDVIGDEEAGSLLVTTSAGGYGQDSGVTLYRKLIFRRLTTDPDSYFHLVNYGLGIQPKTLIRAGDLLALQGATQRQILRESGVVECTVSLSMTGSVLILSYKALIQAVGWISDEWTMPNH